MPSAWMGSDSSPSGHQASSQAGLCPGQGSRSHRKAEASAPYKLLLALAGPELGPPGPSFLAATASAS